MSDDEGLDREYGVAIAEQALDLVAKCGEQLPDDSVLVYIGSTSVWRTPSGEVVVVTLETEL